MTVLTRFAPSPSGRLHLGNARIAILAWLFAKSHGGDMLLRFDDTDRTRSDPSFEAAIREDLRWLGLDWRAEYRQSERSPLYLVHFEELLARGRIYPCYETEEELAALRARALARGEPPRYRRLEGEGGTPAGAAASREPYFRFRLEPQPAVFRDLVFGERTIAVESLSDPVVRRADGSFTYIFASVVDDVDLGITHVVRGEDHLTNTAVQIQIFAALDAKPPAFAHLPLLCDVSGRPLSKRLNDLSLVALRDQGFLAPALFAYLARLGTGIAPAPDDRPESLVRSFDIAAFGRAPARLDIDDLRRFNGRMLRTLSFHEVAAQLAALGLSRVDEEFWQLVRPNVDTLAEVGMWWQIVHGPITPVVTDRELLERAAALLPERLSSPAEARAFLDQLAAATGRRGRALFRPLRLALTGREHGPELALLLPRLGRDRALARLRGETA
ncbi:Glutamate--tRNA ligase 1 [bacterium HR40]|nr:Glutamate--tRNA ligase 1 [bacterium HR40]